MSKKLGTNPVLWGILASALTTSHTAQADDPLWTALTSGKTDFSARLRYENVDDEGAQEDANAYTARITLGYKTGTFHGFGLYGQVEHVQALFGQEYNQPADPKPQYATVVDPEQTEINQSYLFYNGLPDTMFKVGRQIITYRDAPFHRYMGTVLWRQNWQTQDAFTVVNTSLPDTTLSYGYAWNINRIFGEDAPSPLDDFTSDSHYFNGKYTGFKYANIEAYAYLLDFENAAAFSTDTYGIRLNGAFPVNEQIKGIYTAEFATQSDAGDNPNSIDADYFLGEIGAKFKLSGPFESLMMKVSYELQEGNGGADRFVTILGTNHAFQGWADKFLVTPGDGVEDLYFTAVLKAFGAKFVASYHDLSSDKDGYDYGKEIDLEVMKTFNKHYTVGLKYADYEGDKNVMNTSGLSNDLTKFWAFFMVKF